VNQTVACSFDFYDLNKSVGLVADNAARCITDLAHPLINMQMTLIDIQFIYLIFIAEARNLNSFFNFYNIATIFKPNFKGR